MGGHQRRPVGARMSHRQERLRSRLESSACRRGRQPGLWSFATNPSRAVGARVRRVLADPPLATRGHAANGDRPPPGRPQRVSVWPAWQEQLVPPRIDLGIPRGATRWLRRGRTPSRRLNRGDEAQLCQKGFSSLGRALVFKQENHRSDSLRRHLMRARFSSPDLQSGPMAAGTRLT